MKRFFTIIPLQQPGALVSYRYEAVGNQRLQAEGKTAFPILTAMEGYLTAGEEFEAVAVYSPNQPASVHNLGLFREELNGFCRRTGAVCRQLREVAAEPGQEVAAQTALFQKLIDCVADDDELFACMTYGTKPQSTAVQMAVQYAYRLKRNASISCIVYGEIVRPEAAPQSWYGRVYDMTALVRLDEVVRMLADRGVSDPKGAIDALLSL